MSFGKAMYADDDNAFLDACGSAKVVEGPDGVDVLLIGGKIVKIEPAYLVLAISRSLRRSVPKESSASEGQQ